MTKKSTVEPAIGVLGGSGIYDMEGLTKVRKIKVKTPFGAPSDELIEGRVDGRRTIFLPRHGRGHRIPPGEINFRANIWAMKKLGVARIIALSAVGSLREHIVPGDFVVVDQFFDHTKHRPDTFFGKGIVAHASFADPVCKELAMMLASQCEKVGIKTHRAGTYICMEGPLFSTRAESNLYRQWGMDVIGMTNVQEAKLAREAEICYSTVAMATDYDCWYAGHEDVSVEAVVAVMKSNVVKAKDFLRAAIPLLPIKGNCRCDSALENAIMTAKDRIPAKRLRDLKPILAKYFS